MGIGEFYVLLLCLDKRLSKNLSSYEGWIDIKGLSIVKGYLEMLDQLVTNGYLLLSIDMTKVKLVIRKEYVKAKRVLDNTTELW